MEKQIRNTAEEILEEFTNCYSEADEDCLVKMLRGLASDVAREIFEEIETMIFGTIIPNDCAIISTAKLAELKKKYESEGER